MTEPAIRVLDAAGVETLIGWAAAEGWNPGLADAPALRAADPEGFLGCFVDDTLAAAISAVAYDDDFGFIGLYICRPDRRGAGLGRRIWDAGIARLGARTIGLDGVPEQQANYRRKGFEPHHRTLRWSGRATVPATAATGTRTIAPMAPGRLPDVLAFDRRFFPAARTAFLAAWLAPPHRVFLLDGAGGLEAYVVARRCIDGLKLGPLFATGPDAAIALFDACITTFAGDDLHIDVPQPQQAFADHLAARGFAEGFSTRRMVRPGRQPPRSEPGGVFGVTTLELG